MFEFKHVNAINRSINEIPKICLFIWSKLHAASILLSIGNEWLLVYFLSVGSRNSLKKCVLNSLLIKCLHLIYLHQCWWKMYDFNVWVKWGWSWPVVRGVRGSHCYKSRWVFHGIKILCILIFITRFFFPWPFTHSCTYISSQKQAQQFHYSSHAGLPSCHVSAELIHFYNIHLWMIAMSHPCWWWAYRVCWPRAWGPLSRLVPGCCAAWLAARWSPPGVCAALAHAEVLAAICGCGSLPGSRNLDTPVQEDSKHKHRSFRNNMKVLFIPGVWLCS